MRDLLRAILPSLPTLLASLSAALISWANRSKLGEVHTTSQQLQLDLLDAKQLIKDLQTQIVTLTPPPFPPKAPLTPHS